MKAKKGISGLTYQCEKQFFTIDARIEKSKRKRFFNVYCLAICYFSCNSGPCTYFGCQFILLAASYISSAMFRVLWFPMKYANDAGRWPLTRHVTLCFIDFRCLLKNMFLKFWYLCLTLFVEMGMKKYVHCRQPWRIGKHSKVQIDYT